VLILPRAAVIDADAELAAAALHDHDGDRLVERDLLGSTAQRLRRRLVDARAR
jgi:hypothetical protein